ncbi:hypothetical protein LJR039_007092 [Pseudorhodoferax sp. LjRoot39]|uniref:hypothetical protein n=1 Tax=Pseudorhodoferax sp. LjRoot39 TaxID=3342328 RepID=UPI003ECFC484
MPGGTSLLVDVDAMCKLAHWRLLELLPAITGVEPHACSTLVSTRFRALKSVVKPDGKVFRCGNAAQAVLDALEAFGELPQADAPLLAQFQDVVGIDAGEAVMLARLIEDPQAMFLTGDKRALRAVAAMDQAVRDAIAARVVPVECVITCVLDMYGIEELRARVCPWKDVDKAVAIVMGSRCDSSEASVREGLASYVGELHGMCQPSLIRPC